MSEEKTCRCGGRTYMTTWTIDFLSGWYRYCCSCNRAWTDPTTNLRPMGGFCINREGLETVWYDGQQFQVVPEEVES